jgi:hypothetical protein
MNAFSLDAQTAAAADRQCYGEDGGNISLAKNQKAEHVSDRVTFCPVEMVPGRSSAEFVTAQVLNRRTIMLQNG